MKLSEYPWVPDAGNPLPVDAIALLFQEGRAKVMVRVHGLDGWHEAMSAPPPAESEESLACAADFHRNQAFVTVNHGLVTEAHGLQSMEEKS